MLAKSFKQTKRNLIFNLFFEFVEKDCNKLYLYVNNKNFYKSKINSCLKQFDKINRSKSNF